MHIHEGSNINTAITYTHATVHDEQHKEIRVLQTIINNRYSNCSIYHGNDYKTLTETNKLNRHLLNKSGNVNRFNYLILYLALAMFIAMWSYYQGLPVVLHSFLCLP